MSNKQPLPTDLELTALDPVFREHPHDRLDRLRTEDPVHFDAALGRLFLTRFEDMKTVLVDRLLFKGSAQGARHTTPTCDEGAMYPWRPSNRPC